MHHSAGAKGPGFSCRCDRLTASILPPVPPMHISFLDPGNAIASNNSWASSTIAYLLMCLHFSRLALLHFPCPCRSQLSLRAARIIPWSFRSGCTPTRTALLLLHRPTIMLLLLFESGVFRQSQRNQHRRIIFAGGH